MGWEFWREGGNLGWLWTFEKSEVSTVPAVTFLEADVDLGPVLCAPLRVTPSGGGSSPPALSPFFWKTLHAVMQRELRVKQQLANWDMCEFTFCLIVMYVS